MGAVSPFASFALAIVLLVADQVDIGPLAQFGVLGIVLSAVLWLLKQFFDNTMKQQRDLVDTLQSIRESHSRMAGTLAALEERMTSHMKDDEQIDEQILGALRRVSCVKRSETKEDP